MLPNFVVAHQPWLTINSSNGLTHQSAIAFKGQIKDIGRLD